MKTTIIAAFDFDGTIIDKDSFLEFIKFSKGQTAFYMGFFLHIPLLIAYKLKLYPNWKIKQKIFKYFFRGTKYNEFYNLGILFSNRIENMLYPAATETINMHLQQKHKIYIISASIEEWIKPWCNKRGIYQVLGTQIEKDHNGKLTGNFITPNCQGIEKVNRLLEKEPMRKSYILYAYGNSKGDKELIEFADRGWYNKFKTK